MERILVTGACGFIGSSVVELLTNRGYKVYGLDLKGKKMPSNISIPDGYFDLIWCDLLNDDLEKKIPDDITHVLHLASLTSLVESFNNPLLYEKVNVEGTLRLMTACGQKGIRSFVYVSSFAVYGDFHSDYRNDHHPTQPLSPYGISKLAAEMYVHILAPKLGFDSVVLRLANVYGRNQLQSSTNLLQAFISSALKEEDIIVFGDGKHRRSFLHVSDAALALLKTVQAHGICGLTFDICDEMSYDVLQIARMIINQVGNSKVKIIFKNSEIQLAQDTPCYSKNAVELLKFKPKVNLETGIKELIADLRKKM
jgi:UDP-glucose 4-epimerase